MENGFFLDGGWRGSTYAGKVPVAMNAFEEGASGLLKIDITQKPSRENQCPKSSIEPNKYGEICAPGLYMISDI